MDEATRIRTLREQLAKAKAKAERNPTERNRDHVRLLANIILKQVAK